jgi:hypothetical protein
MITNITTAILTEQALAVASLVTLATGSPAIVTNCLVTLSLGAFVVAALLDMIGKP